MAPLTLGGPQRYPLGRPSRIETLEPIIPRWQTIREWVRNEYADPYGYSSTTPRISKEI
jgi:hypothetical protein